MRGLITANLKVLGTYPNDNDELIIAKIGSMTSGSTSFSSLDGIGSNIHVVGLDQGSSIGGPRATSGPRERNVWPALISNNGELKFKRSIRK